MSDEKKIDFGEILSEPQAAPGQDGDPVAILLSHIEGLAEAAQVKFAEVEAHSLAIEGRLEMVEKYLGFLLTKNEEFKEWVKQQAEAAKGTTNVGQGEQGT